jgi:hypothetical protein
MQLTFDDVLGWSEVMKNYSKEMIYLILILEPNWEHNAKELFRTLQAGMLTYTPLKMYKNSELQETKSRWHQILRGVN